MRATKSDISALSRGAFIRAMLTWARWKSGTASALGGHRGQGGDGLPVAGGRANAEGALEGVVVQLGVAVAVGADEVDRRAQALELVAAGRDGLHLFEAGAGRGLGQEGDVQLGRVDAL